MAETRIKVIFHRRYRVLTIMLVAIMAIIAIIMAWGADDRQAGIVVGLISVPSVAAICALAGHFAGRRQVSWIAEDGPDLLVRRVHFLDAGKKLRIPKRDITDWRVETKHYEGHAYSDVSFRYGGSVFAIYISEDAHPDMAAFEALTPGGLSLDRL